MSDKIKVRITASHRVKYDQTVEMTRKEWDELKKSIVSDDDGTVAEDWLDLRDVFDSDTIEADDVEAFVVDENDKILETL